jgi:hypothetical protein
MHGLPDDATSETADFTAFCLGITEQGAKGKKGQDKR